MLFGSFVSHCYVLNLSSQNVCVEALAVFAAVFGNRAFKEVIKVK